MKKVYGELVKQGTTPSVADISRLMKAVGPRGQKRKEKHQAVRDLFDELGIAGTNSQGYHVADTLSSYGEF